VGSSERAEKKTPACFDASVEGAVLPQRYLTSFVTGSRMLRKPVRAKELEAVRAQLSDDALALGFQPLRGAVAVSLSLHPPANGRQQPELPNVVKAYLDALETIAYADDRQVEYLQVREHSMRHPMLDGYVPKDGDAGEAAIFIEVEPVEDYTERYDRAVRASILKRQSPWWPEWSISDGIELARSRSDLRRTPDADCRAIREVVRNLEERQLTDGVLADIDRPGPLPTAAQAVHRLLPIQRFLRATRRRSGAAFWISLRGGPRDSTAAWNEELQDALEQFKGRSVGLPLRGFLALDIAVRGTSLEGKDLDNLAHSILVPFEEVLCVRRGTVIGYRVYTAPGNPEGVQVRVLDSNRLLALDIALGELRGKPTLEQRIEAWGADMQARLKARAEELERR
jgi:Holliday junction resolvase RusA-like endonuclease